MNAPISLVEKAPYNSPVCQEIAAKLEEHRSSVCTWVESKRRVAPPFIYNSVDLRHAGFKLAPVDTNLFPAGFNNLSPSSRERAAANFAAHLTRHFPNARRLLIFPEAHTRNLAYLDNLYVLKTLLEAAGAEVQIATAGEQEEHLVSRSGHEIIKWPLRAGAKKLVTKQGFLPDLIIANHDFTSGVPEILQNLEQPITPPPGLGWHTRRKSAHFAMYDVLATELSLILDIDPWLITTLTQHCGAINFGERQGVDCVANNVDKLMHSLRRKYESFGITDEPYVYIKADGGTYGMGIMSVKSGEEVLAMNKKTRNKMDVIKEGANVTEVIIQEGVPSIDEVDGSPAEPMIYLADGRPIGGAWRFNPGRDARGNLNAAGMEFKKMCDEENEVAKRNFTDCQFNAFGIVAQVAALAVAREEYEN